ncbi:hypothetical protein IQ266_17930 [filamentous cyanobacterium LEGE 11480]|uniref:Uncharacterized protein n=1 Tax=Romeriopsis navalis LEGE 11480 TaxID=2777977 RepID=A0A928VRG8_9CYAN|nr:hypothetical protein [Romeriopsis navalis LEGE 11480]
MVIAALTRAFPITKNDWNSADRQAIYKQIHQQAIRYYGELLADTETAWVSLQWESYA